MQLCSEGTGSREHVGFKTKLLDVILLGDCINWQHGKVSELATLLQVHRNTISDRKKRKREEPMAGVQPYSGPPETATRSDTFAIKCVLMHTFFQIYEVPLYIWFLVCLYPNDCNVTTVNLVSGTKNWSL